jgi:hypothetical protein
MFRIGQNAVGVDGSIYNSAFSLKRFESIIFMITGCNRRAAKFPQRPEGIRAQIDDPGPAFMFGRPRLDLPKPLKLKRLKNRCIADTAAEITPAGPILAGDSPCWSPPAV